jgi:hypothetical protein
LDLCLCVVVVVVGVVVAGVLLVVGVALVVDEDELLLPHPDTAAVLARTATVVSMAVSEVLLMGRAPDLARGFERSPYQSLAMPFAAGFAPAIAGGTGPPDSGRSAAAG